jgi:DNA-binding response OmpR family regulator
MASSDASDSPSVDSSGLLLLDVSERRIQGVRMPALFTGEYRLLIHLGKHPGRWHSTRRLSMDVYQREDFSGRQLVWKYASTLRKKLKSELPELIQLCRRRGYACSVLIKLSQPDDGEMTDEVCESKSSASISG